MNSRRFRLPFLFGGVVIIALLAGVWAVWAGDGRGGLTQPGAPRVERQRTPIPPREGQTGRSSPSPAGLPAPDAGPSSVLVEKNEDNTFRYLVNGEPQIFIGMGYNPIYRYLSDEERADNYDRDFRILCRAGVNHITGWDADKGYEQDKFDEITLDYAYKYGIGVLMPFVLPAEGDYQDEAFRQGLLDEAAAKVERFRDHPALRMWGVGNEVILDGLPQSMMPAFGRFYLEMADLIHDLDPNHPVMYRESEDFMVPAIVRFLQRNPPERPWLLYGMNIYTMGLERILDTWPYYGFDRPLFVSEFGAEEYWPGGRAMGYLDMWRMIRSHPDYVMGGAPYVWTTEGPEPVDKKWGLMDGNSRPVDDTFRQLRADWLKEKGARRTCP